eukprot:1038616-Amphidinium_carterae.1
MQRSTIRVASSSPRFQQLGAAVVLAVVQLRWRRFACIGLCAFGLVAATAITRLLGLNTASLWIFREMRFRATCLGPHRLRVFAVREEHGTTRLQLACSRDGTACPSSVHARLCRARIIITSAQFCLIGICSVCSRPWALGLNASGAKPHQTQITALGMQLFPPKPLH